MAMLLILISLSSIVLAYFTQDPEQNLKGSLPSLKVLDCVPSRPKVMNQE